MTWRPLKISSPALMLASNPLMFRIGWAHLDSNSYPLGLENDALSLVMNSDETVVHLLSLAEMHSDQV